MRIVFGQVFSDSKESYVREKLERDFRRCADLGAKPDDDYFSKQTANVINDQLGNPVPFALPDAFYEITAEQEAQIEARKRCVLAALLRESPLLDGETVQEDLFTFLQQPFETLPVNTAVLRRTTNMAELFYLFDDVQVVAGDLRFIEPEPVPYTPAVAPPRAALKASFNASSIAKGLADGLVSGIGGKIGGLIFEAIFPPGVPDYFDEVYKEIGKIVKSELTQNTIDQTNGRINGVVAWMKNTYKPRKESGATRDELSNMISRQVELLYTEAAYTLMETRYAKSGVSVFMVAAGVHLGLMQEQALVDPRQPDAGKSSYAISVKLNAQTYADHLVKTFDALVNDRKNLVDIAYDPLVFDNPPPKDRYRFRDKLTNTWGNIHEQYMDKDKKNHTGEEEAEADRQKYLPGVVNKLTNDLGNPRNTASQWLKLTTKPIP